VKHYQVIILPSAEREITEVYDWLTERNEEAAADWNLTLFDVILSLETFPERCPLAPESRFFEREIRQIIHGRRQHKYRILFSVSDRLVEILHVRHGSRLSLGETEISEE
jgi:plasmid stabilization system protein ParE